MTLTLEITRKDFEAALPVGISSSDEIFEKVQPEFANVLDYTESQVLGSVGVEIIQQGKSSMLLHYLLWYICVTATLQRLRQLDLVLTPAGFGVVSSENYAPASKMRVDALEGSLRTLQAKYLAYMCNTLRCPEWAALPQAEDNIPFVEDALTFFGQYPSASYQDWLETKELLESSDILLRKKMGDEQMDAIMLRYRSGADACADDHLILARMHRYYRRCVADGEAMGCAKMWPEIAKALLKQPTIYKEFMDSSEYQAFIHEKFQNTKNSTAYVFG